MANTKRDDRTAFSQMIERKALTNKSTHIDAIISHCEETGLEIEMVKVLINSQLKKKIEAEATSLRLLTGSSDELLP